MGYVYMRVLEATPDEYESGIAKLTAGQLEEVYERIITFITSGDKVLELGCGPGTLSVSCAKKGAKVVAIDLSEKMITVAQEKAQREGSLENIRFIEGDFTQIGSILANEKFDIIISTLALSELRHLEHQIVFDQCWELLNDEGKIAFADEVKPEGIGYYRLNYSIKRFFHRLFTYWKTKLTTSAIERFQERLETSGFDSIHTERFVKDTLKLIVAKKRKNGPPPALLKDQKMRGIRGWIRGGLCILRAGSALIPIEPGLYIYGNPTDESPVLVTANYQRTVRIVGSALNDKNAFLLVADTMGENVWCAARGDKFSTAVIAEVIKATRINELVDHRKVILPQLAAGGIDHREVKETTGWSARFGPVYAKDIPYYLETGMKTQKQRTVSFDLKERIEMSLQQSFFLSKFFFFWLALSGLLVGIIFPQLKITWIAVLLLPLVWIVYLLFAVIFPLFPTKSFLKRGILFGIILAFLFAGSTVLNGWTLIESGQWFVIGFVLGVFLGMDYSGSTPISKPTEIDEDYPTMIIILGGSIILLFALIITGLMLGQ